MRLRHSSWLLFREERLMNSYKLKKKELIAFIALIVIAAVLWLVMSRQRASVDHGSIRITVSGREYGTYSLGKDQKIRINGTNTCRIKDGQVKMIEATCPDHLCISQPPVDEKGGFIICLPNEVIIEGIPSEETTVSDSGLDAVVN